MNPHLPARENVETYIIHLLSERHIRLQPHRLINMVGKAFPDQSRSQIRIVIKTMVTKGALLYTNAFSSTYLIRNQKTGLNIRRALTVGSDVSWAGRYFQTIPIRLGDGLAFGYGNHPTTRLCLKGMEMVMQDTCHADPDQYLTVLDIGTGSGVLAIAAALLGAQKVIAVDTDPLACREARINVDLNQLSKKIAIFTGDLTIIKAQSFDLVLANLRGPTLKSLLGYIAARINDGGKAVFSGFRLSEKSVIEEMFRMPRWKILWSADNRGWAAVAVGRQADR
jgi:ribosomal protein L11 methyltransferase